MPDPALDDLYTKIRQKRAADPAGFAAKMARVRQASADDPEFQAMLDEVDALPSWQEAGGGTSIATGLQKGQLGAARGLFSPLALTEALGRKAVAATARAFDGAVGLPEGTAAHVDSVDSARGSYGPLGWYTGLADRQEALRNAEASYDQPTGLRGVATRTAAGAAEFLPDLALGGLAGGAERAALKIGESAAPAIARQAALFGAQAGETALEGVSTPDRAPTGREIVNAGAQAGIAAATAGAMGKIGLMAAFSPARAVVPLGRRIAEDVGGQVAGMAAQSEASLLADKGILESRLPTAAEQGEAVAGGALTGLGFAGLSSAHAIARSFSGRTPVTVDLARPDPAPAPAAPAPQPVAAAASAPQPMAAPEPIARPAPLAPPEPAIAAPAEHPNLEGAAGLLAKGRTLAAQLDEDHAQMLGREAAPIVDVDAEGAYVHAADGELVHIPGEAILGVHDLTNDLQERADAGRGRGAAEPAAEAPVAVVDARPAEPRPAAPRPEAAAPAVERPAVAPGDAAVAAEPQRVERPAVAAKEQRPIEPAKPAVAAEPTVAPKATEKSTSPVENVSKASPKSAEKLVVRTPGGKGEAYGTSVVEQVGHNHFVARTPDGKFIVAGTDRHSVARARRRGTAIPLQPSDPVLGRVPNPRLKEAHSGRIPTRYASAEEARAAAKKASDAYAEPEDVLGGERKAKAGEGPTGGRGAEAPIEVVAGTESGGETGLTKKADAIIASGKKRPQDEETRVIDRAPPAETELERIARAARERSEVAGAGGAKYTGDDLIKIKRMNEREGAKGAQAVQRGLERDLAAARQDLENGGKPTIQIEPEDAAKLGLTPGQLPIAHIDGDTVHVYDGGKLVAVPASRVVYIHLSEKPAPAARTKAERTEAKREARKAGDVEPATPETDSAEANVAKASERVNRAIMQIEEAPPRLADVQKAVHEAKKEFHEGLAPDSVMHAYGQAIFGERNLAKLGLSVNADGPTFARALSKLHEQLGKANVEIARRIRVEGARATMRQPLLGTAAADGMSVEARHGALQDLAKSLGLPLVIADGEIRAHGRSVGGFYDPLTESVVLAKPRSFAEGASAIAHEAMHAEVKGLPSTAKQALFDAVASAIGDPLGHAELVAKRWRKLVPKNADPLHGPLEETLGDAASEALLTNHNQILGELPADVGSKLVRVLHRIGNALVRMVKRLAGVDGLKTSERKAMKDIAERLLRSRIERARKSTEKAQTLNELMTDLISEAKGEPEVLPVVDPKSDDLHERVLNNAAKLQLGDAKATAVQQTSIAAWADLLHVARKFPMVDAVAKGLEVADAAHHGRLASISGDVGPALKHFESRPPMQRKLLDLRLADIERMEAGKPRFSTEQGLEWLRQKGATPADLQHAQTLWSAGHMLRDAHLDALARTLGLKRAFSLDETKGMLSDFEGLPKTAQVEGMKQTLDAWKDVAEEFDKSTSNVYAPLVRLPADDVIIGSGVPGLKDGRLREPVTRAKRDARLAELRKQHPDAEFTSEPQPMRFDAAPAADRLIDRVRDAAARAGLEGKDVEALIEVVRPALLSHLVDTSRLQARGIEGYETDLGKAMAFYTKGANRGISRLDALARTREALAALAGDKQRPRLAEFGRGVMTADPDVSPAWGAVRQGVAARVLSGGFAAAQNVVSGVTLNPFILAHLSGKLVGPVAGQLAEMAKVSVHVPAMLADVGNLVFSRREAGSHVVEAAAERVGGAAGEALRKALRETDVLKDPELSLLDDHLTTGVGTAAAKVARAAMSLFVVSDRVQRTATFLTAFKTAERFKPEDWTHVKEKGYHRGEDPYEFATWATKNTVGAYGARYRPPAFRGAKAALAYQMAGWSKHTTQAMFDMVRGMKGQRGLVSAGAFVGLAALGTMLHGLKGGVPFFGQAASDASDLLGKLFGTRGLDDMVQDSINESDRTGDHGLAFALRTIRGGAGDAAAGATEKGSVGHRVAAAAESVAAGTAPRGLLLATLTARLDGGRFPIVRAVQGLHDAAADIAGGIKADNKEAVARGIAGIIGGPLPGTFRAVEERLGKGVTNPMAADGKPGHTAAPSAGWEDAALLASGFEPAESARLRGLTRDLAEQHTLQQASLDTRIYGVVDAMRSGDESAVGRANADLSAYVQAQAKRLSTVTEPGERARLYAELGWMLGKNPSRELEQRVKQAWLNRRYGLDVPLASPDWFMHSESAKAAGGGD